ncbi:hypothetical protein [Nostoc sp. T09]|uniref:hypothetical protein n=1 Tax=Nostoc sp. T09 TaxID=1932621 RepID=UPI001180F331|nr:hypothetical protein [Nostoc sp. T09]
MSTIDKFISSGPCCVIYLDEVISNVSTVAVEGIALLKIGRVSILSVNLLHNQNLDKLISNIYSRWISKRSQLNHSQPRNFMRSLYQMLYLRIFNEKTALDKSSL